MKHCALYIHIPFCVRKCAYCDFPSYAHKTDRIPEYLRLLEAEMHEAALAFGPLAIDTLFVGGGTPSLLTGEQVEALLNCVREHFLLMDDAEITMECNPGTLTAAKLAHYRSAGVNRLSIGIQSFDDRLLSALGRIHTSALAAESVHMAAETGFTNINIDLMYALPHQTRADWHSTLEKAPALPISHISCYSLIVEDGTPMKQLAESSPLIFPGDEESLDMQHTAANFLSEHGFGRYEISNYAKPGAECRHNLAYWRRTDYLGLGCAAHSLMNGERFANSNSLDDYFAGLRHVTREALTPQDVYEESVMLGLRTREGTPATLLQGKEAIVRRLTDSGLLHLNNGLISVTTAGADVLNAIILELI